MLSGAPPATRDPAPGRLVLASASPRRALLLQQIGWPADLIDAPAVDERVGRGELPRPHAVAPRHPGCYVIAADTVVACGRRILPKAEAEPVARRCLQLLSGRRHRVFGGVAAIGPSGRQSARVVTTIVTVKRLSAAEIDAYIASGEWQGKAGGYAIQGRAATLISGISGSYSNVVGLALFEAHQMLTGLGYRGPA